MQLVHQIREIRPIRGNNRRRRRMHVALDVKPIGHVSIGNRHVQDLAHLTGVRIATERKVNIK